MNAGFEKELTQLINRHSIENEVDMPDFLLARMLCVMIESMGPTVKATLDWHGCDSVCHPRPNKCSAIPEWAATEIRETWRAAREAGGELQAFRIIERMVDRLGYGRAENNPPLLPNK